LTSTIHKCGYYAVLIGKTVVRAPARVALGMLAICVLICWIILGQPRRPSIDLQWTGAELSRIFDASDGEFLLVDMTIVSRGALLILDDDNICIEAQVAGRWIPADALFHSPRRSPRTEWQLTVLMPAGADVSRIHLALQSVDVRWQARLDERLHALSSWSMRGSRKPLGWLAQVRPTIDPYTRWIRSANDPRLSEPNYRYRRSGEWRSMTLESPLPPELIGKATRLDNRHP
jgi:hypothetical protein